MVKTQSLTLKRILRRSLVVALMPLLVAGLTACSGSDGSRGPMGTAGATGPTGPTGATGPVATTNESCNVCHGDNAVVSIQDVHSLPTDAPLSMDVNGVVATVTPLDQKYIAVTFTTTVGTLTAADLRVYLADIVPAGTLSKVTGDTWPTAYLERWAYESTSSTNLHGALSTATKNADGSYTYTYTSGTDYTDANGIVAPASTSHGGDPLPAATLAQVAPEMNIYADTQRVIVRASVSGYATGLAIQDFTVADSGDPAVADTVTDVAPDRVLAPITGCKQCHSDEMQGAAHASSYPDTRACNICHSPISGWPHSYNAAGTGYYGNANAYGEDITADGAWLTRYIHQLHDGNTWFNDPVTWEITYPENIKNCQKCHNGDDNMSDAWKSNPSKAACTACHNVAANAHPNDQPDSACSGCHTPDSNIIAGVEVGISAVHKVTTLKNAPDVSITPVYTAHIAITNPANGQYWVAGETPVVTITTSYDSNGVVIDPSNFNTANLYVYGPRSKAVPVLTPNSTTDPNWDPTTAPTQGDNLFNDPNATMDANGIKVSLQTIPAGMTAGTYMIMARMEDRAVSRSIPGGHTYYIDGWQLINFQIGTADVQPRVAGDGCNKCHNLQDWTSTAHRAYFGTDGCLACHDQSGGHAVTIANRVHAVHGATVNGDLNNHDWSEITYPSDLTNCTVCHNSGDTSFEAPDDATQPSQWAKPCIGCHGDTPGAYDHMLQNGGALPAE